MRGGILETSKEGLKGGSWQQNLSLLQADGRWSLEIDCRRRREKEKETREREEGAGVEGRSVIREGGRT